VKVARAGIGLAGEFGSDKTEDNGSERVDSRAHHRGVGFESTTEGSEIAGDGG
jgi:hypothetical protein